MSRPEDDWGPEFDDRPPRPDPPEEEEDSPEFAAIRTIELLSRLHHMAFRASLQSDGLPPAQAGAMKVIIRHPGMSQRELADKLHIQRATATVMLQKMEKSGHITRCSDRDDQRISRIYPTETAISLDIENRKNVNDYFARCFKGVDSEEFHALERTLQKIGGNLREILAESPPPPGPPEPPKPLMEE